MISAISVKKPYTVLVAVVLVIVLGLVSFTGMTTDLLPEMNLPYVIVMTSYPGASPEQVETVLTRPLESVLGTAGGLNSIRSVSSENSSMIILEFNQQMNMDSAMIDLSGRIDLLADYLPDEAGRPMLMRISPDMLPIMIASIDKEDMPLAELSEWVSEDILPRFERISGVASVEAEGLLQEYLHFSIRSDQIVKLNEEMAAQIKDQLGETRAQLEEAQSELAAGRQALDEEVPEQQEQLAEASLQLTQAMSKIEAILAEEAVLQAQQAAFEHEKSALAGILDQIQSQVPDQWPDFTTIIQLGENPDLERMIAEMEEGLDQLTMLLLRQVAVDAELQNIQVRLMTLEAMKPELEKGLSEAQAAYLELQQGKLTFSVEIAQARMQMEQGEADLAEGLAELERAQEEALKQADLAQIITADMISQLIRAQHFSMPAGYLQDEGSPMLVKVGDEFSQAQELENMLLFSFDAVGDIRLADVADMVIRDNADESYTRINGQPGIVLTFQKQSAASTSEVTRLIHAEIDFLTEQHPGLQVVALMDQGDYINLITRSVLQNLLWGGLLAILILILFLKDLRPTFVIAVSIPVSLLFALALMYFSSITLNLVSLSGLALAVGMLVDNSIVVIENIYRLRNQGMSAAKAAVLGAKQMSGAIFASTLTTVCVFLPIVFTDGLSRQLFTDMGLTIAYSLVASLIIALTLVPSLSASLLQSTREKKHPWFDSISNLYARSLRLSLRFKPVVLVLAVVLLALSLIGASIMGLAFLPEMDSPQMSVSLTLPPEESSGDTFALIDEINDRIMSIEAVAYVGALSGGFGFGNGASDDILFYVLLREDRDMSNHDVERAIYEKTEDIDVELLVSTSEMDLSMLGGSGIQLSIKGNNLDLLAETAAELAGLIGQVEGIQQVEWQGEDADTELRVIVRKDAAMEKGLTVAQVFQEIAQVLRDDQQVITLTDNYHDRPVMIANPKREQLTQDGLADFLITATDRDGNQESWPLGEIADIEEAFSPTAIHRDNQSRYITISAQVKDGYNTSLVNREVISRLDTYSLPAGLSLEMGGETETILETLDDLFLVIALAILFIYLIMVAQFQNLLAPFIILFTIPLAFTGGLLLLWILNFELSVIAMLGFLMLAGIVVNNGIVFISTVNQLRQEGIGQHDALLQTGKMRIRPILMTALTTILAMSTLAFGIGSGAEMTQPMAIVTIGGLGYATILTLFVVPVLYDLFHRKPLKIVDLEDPSHD